MTIGSYLTSQAKITAGDQVVILSERNGGARRASIGAISDFVEAAMGGGGGGGGSGGPVSFDQITGGPNDNSALAQAFQALTTTLRGEITAGADSAAQAIAVIRGLVDEGSEASDALLTVIASCLRFDAGQTLNDAQKAQAALNLGIATRLLPAGERLPGQIPLVNTDGSLYWGFIPGVTSTVDPLVTQAIAISNQVSGAMRLRTISLGAE